MSMTALGQPLKVNASSIPGSFAKGADVSWLPQMEAQGYKFYNDQGAEQDLLQILKDHGIDSIRLRAFVNPSDDPSNGHNSTEEVVALASRVSALGFRIMIDLHYSDSWADPGKQVTPAAWAIDNLEQLKAHVSEYTSEVMNALKTAGVTPEWVQIGNEINNGMMHPLGSYSNTANLVQLIQAGSGAAKAVFLLLRSSFIEPTVQIVVRIRSMPVWQGRVLRTVITTSLGYPIIRIRSSLPPLMNYPPT